MKNIALFILLAPILSGCFIATTLQGNGTVTSVGTDHFDCATGQAGDCSQEYSSAGSETLQATPDAGYSFSKWTNCPYETIETCKVEWNDTGASTSNTIPVIATFEEQNPPVQAAQYTYNALGQRMTKTVAGKTTVFQYDLDGKLMAEIDAATGTALRQHVHVNGEPIAQLSTNPSTGAITVQYVHADHLGAPTLLTNERGEVVADIEATPFGETYIDYAEVTQNRRFPGQYRDWETGLHYNYFRDYDPTVGRYIQSDPVGLAGDWNTYAYVGGDPISHSDFFGLMRDVAKGIPKCWSSLLRTDRESFEKVLLRAIRIYHQIEFRILRTKARGVSILPQPRFDPVPALEIGVYKVRRRSGVREIYEVDKITKILKVMCQYRWKDECGDVQESFDSFERKDTRSSQTLISSEYFDEFLSEALLGAFET